MSAQELLQQIVTNTTPVKTTMISVSTTNLEFSINFPTAISANEIALAQLRVYHSWPNIRSEPFGGLPPNNSLVLANKDKPDGTPDFFVVYIPTGSYQIEQINDEFERTIKSTTKKESKITITVHEPTLSSVIEIKSPDYVVDIYQSSIKTVLRWPKTPPNDYNFLRYDNNPDAEGRHISPEIVNITSTIAVNLVCDAIDGSYRTDLGISNQAQQGYVLYTFTPIVPPGSLIVQEPINPVYLRTHNQYLSRINFKLTDQSGHLIDLRGEVLLINLYVKS